MHINDAIALLRLHAESCGRSSNTIQQLDRHARAFAAWLATERLSTDVASLTPEVISRFFTSAAARTSARGCVKAAASVNALRSSIRSLFRLLHGAGHIAADPTRLLRPAICSSPPPRFLSAADEAKLMAVLDAATDPVARRDRALIVLLARTGIRISSALGIDVGDLDRGALEITLRIAKRDAPDRVPVSQATMAVLLELAAERASGPLFVSGRGDRRLGRRHAARRLQAWSRRAGIGGRLNPHMFRHALAVRLLEATSDLRLTQEAMRHKSIGSTVRYTQVASSKVRAALLALERTG